VNAYLRLSESMLPTVEVNCRRLISFEADFRFCLGSGRRGGTSTTRFSFLRARAWCLLGPVTALCLSVGGKGGGPGGSSSAGRDFARSDFDLLRRYMSGGIGDLTIPRSDRRSSSISLSIGGAEDRGLSALDCGAGGIGTGWGALLVDLGGGEGSSWAVLEEQRPMKECYYLGLGG
jgi:hypothetical protein